MDQLGGVGNWPCNYAARNDCPGELRNLLLPFIARGRNVRRERGAFLEKIERYGCVYWSELIDQLTTLRHTVGRRVTETGYAQSHASPLSASSYLLPPISTHDHVTYTRVYV